MHRLVCALAAALVVAGALAMPVDAQQPRCKDEVYRSAANAQFRPRTRERELAGNGVAYQKAVRNWEREVAATHGRAWARYDRARRKTKQCRAASEGAVGRNFIRCEVSGQPCAN